MKREKDYYLRQYMEKDEKLSRFVQSYWVLKLKGRDEKIPKLFPLTSAHIIINIEDPTVFKRPGIEVSDMEDQVFHASTQIWDIYYGENTHMVGIELSPQGYYLLTGRDAGERMDTVELLREADPGLEDFIRENRGQISEEDYEGLRGYLEKRFSPSYVDENTLVIQGVIEAIEEGRKIGDLPEHYGLSMRTIERNFRRYTGFTLKKYQLIVRLNRLLEEVYRNDDVDWGDLAVKYGFFDQAHMIKVIKKYLGKTPGEYTAVRDLLGDLYEVE